ncbi:hypothetical protein [Plantactinospora sp. GCM10030261]|uniref:hypothetical protein n=1 Tax=Plantactinospora sp. GCM10030261 TaxID=3273420 RepID=UPI00361D6092
MRAPTVDQRAMCLIATVALGLGSVVAFWLGVYSLGNGLTYAGRLTGALIVVAGVTMLAGSFAAVDLYRSTVPRSAGGRRPAFRASPALVLVGALAVLSLGLTLLVTQVWSGDPGPAVVLWIVLIVLALTVLTLLSARVEIPVLSPRKFAVGLSVTALIGVANFAYSQIYLPAAQMPSVSVKPEFGTPSRAPGRPDVSVPVSVTVKVGPTALVLLAATYTVQGTVAEIRPGRDAARLRADLSRERDPSATTDVAREEFLQAGHLLRPGTELAPGDETRLTEIVHLRAPVDYTSVQLSVRLYYLRGDRAKLDGYDQAETSFDGDGVRHVRDGPDWASEPGDDYVLFSGVLTEGNEVFRRTRNTVYACFWWVLPRDGDGRPTAPSTNVILSYVDPSRRDTQNFDGDDGSSTMTPRKVANRYSAWQQTANVVLPTSDFKVPLS